MQTDGGLLYSQIENQLPGFVQQNHTQFSKFVEKYYEFLELNLLTFTDLDLNEDSIIQESANTIYTVTVATGNNVYSNGANKFYIDDAVSPTLTLTTGTYAIFDQGDETNDTHYFRDIDYYSSKATSGVDFRAKNYDPIENLQENSLDFYASVKSLYLQDRQQKIANTKKITNTQDDSDWEEIENK